MPSRRRYIPKADGRQRPLAVAALECKMAQRATEDGVATVSEVGTGQGSVISPLLANIYSHYRLGLWTHRWRSHEAQGDMVIVRYADDFVVGFEYETTLNASGMHCASG
jgi:retron-type reverse transcriptase